MTKDQETILRFARFAIEDSKDYTLELMKKEIKITCVSREIKLNEQEFIEVLKELESEFQIESSPVVCISNNEEDSLWYSNKNKKDTFYWDRYKKYLIEEKKFSHKIVNNLSDEILDKKLMNQLGDPNSPNNFNKRGLVIGEVQSGKTSTYLGLICKAADIGYKLIIVLAGLTNDLRNQTQVRIEEGFIGCDVSNNYNLVGVKEDPKKPVYTFTDRIDDFNPNQTKRQFNKDSCNIMVVKKNVKTLSNINKWAKNPQLKDVPMLIIDDEADNASINTRKESNPTIVNKTIREILNQFNKSNYIGFTATPYANVFIEPTSQEEMVGQDLFPEDFIVALPIPSNYIGADAIFRDGAKYNKQLRYIKDAGTSKDDGYSYYVNHEKTWNGELPSSLIDALYAFYLTNSIRDLKNQQSSHRSMLINISRYIEVQFHTLYLLEEIHKNALTAINFFINDEDNLIIKKIKKVWMDEYSKLDISWESIKKTLLESNKDIEIKVINSENKDKLVYDENSSTRVIAIGGLALSRGLTLEGLVISYFLRNTTTYDVLLQMGRWFGYRKGYENLFRIWLSSQSAEWYEEVSEASTQLREDMLKMSFLNKKPSEFGIRVLKDSKKLKITANNKMKNTKEITKTFTYAGRFVETPYVSPNIENQTINYQAVMTLINKARLENKLCQPSPTTATMFASNIEQVEIYSFLNKLKLPPVNRFNLSDVIDYVKTTNYKNYDIVILNGSSDRGNLEISNNYRYISRKNCFVKDDLLHLSSRGKLSGPADGKHGLKPTQIKQIENDNYNEKGNVIDNSDSGLATEAWFKFSYDRNPLLAIYLIDISSDTLDSKTEEFKQKLGEIPVVGIGVGFPNTYEIDGRKNKVYKVNTTYNYFELQKQLEDDGEELL